ncbi:MAG: SoxR reducing system RseC family protein [Bacteroidales bacterium]|jgi:sigma-E factor negative regulatory protein RseC|nr:SoxR reducing system RseC family protein [Bacteroidales bacterium]MBO7305686.1 SoxR reducing system RseC family protein [Bacteroidales bacterium]MBQ1218820.1 SoxR reducing system RseC family protein [Bacteroidales bacterium]MBQ1929293.1 SoxR reducing system RseC family protein [Bacteroidales bacterium]MBQ5783396.1 SoxR reducing system RseC family protein [Bacteroidales bacterium]
MENVDHEGVITSITEDNIKVEIINKSLCASCHAKSFCSASDQKEKVIDVPYYNNNEFEVGEIVIVSMKKSMGFKAVWISYVIPLAILMIFLLTLQQINPNDLFVGGISILAVVMYYIIIYLLRDKISNKFVFTIAKKQ